MTDAGSIPAVGGSYALWLRLEKACRITVGRFGCWQFAAGDYLYAGSALGSGGLHARLKRHFSHPVRLHWHIDYLRREAQIMGAFYQVSGLALECLWSQAVAQAPGAQIPVPHFGASDCRRTCPAHLVYFPAGLSEPRLAALLACAAEASQLVFVHP